MQRRALYLEGVHPELLEVPQVRPVESGDDEEKLLAKTKAKLKTIQI